VSERFAALQVPASPRTTDSHHPPSARSRPDLHSVGALGTRIFEITPSSTASNSMSPCRSRSRPGCRRRDAVAFLDQPFGERALLHGRGQRRHLQFTPISSAPPALRCEARPARLGRFFSELWQLRPRCP
jgi:hypothetical protein